MSTKYRKPIPKTQREISISQQTASDKQRGNPNAQDRDWETATSSLGI